MLADMIGRYIRERSKHAWHGLCSGFPVVRACDWEGWSAAELSGVMLIGPCCLFRSLVPNPSINRSRWLNRGTACRHKARPVWYCSNGLKCGSDNGWGPLLDTKSSEPSLPVELTTVRAACAESLWYESTLGIIVPILPWLGNTHV
jgi:hypothetical protein